MQQRNTNSRVNSIFDTCWLLPSRTRPISSNTSTMSQATTSASTGQEQKSSGGGGLPPILGKLGSVAFFLTLFALANPDKEGYEQFRKCHGNCVNGLLHSIGMPLAVSGVFLIVRSVSDAPEFTRHLSFLVTTRYLYLYLQYEAHPYSPWLFYIMYMSIWEFVLYRKVYNNPSWSRLSFLIFGILLVLMNVGALESVGHGIFEKHHSYVSEFFNVSGYSIYTWFSISGDDGMSHHFLMNSECVPYAPLRNQFGDRWMPAVNCDQFR